MEILKVKDTEYKLFLPKEWTSLDEDVFLRRVSDRIFELIALYFIEDYEGNTYFNIAKGKVDLDKIKYDTLKYALDIYGWKYDLKYKMIITDDKIFDSDRSDYLLAEILLNRCNKGYLDIIKCDSFKDVVAILNEVAFTASQLAHNYIQSSKDWLIEEYGKYEGYTTGMDINEDSNNKDIRDSLQKEIERDNSVSKVWWEKENYGENYGYVLWIKFL